eukprot:11388733-Alexandrium_andersonii.AAC.1
MSDTGETVPLGGVFDDVDAEMDYLMGLLESSSSRSSSSNSSASSPSVSFALNEAPDFIRA